MTIEDIQNPKLIILSSQPLGKNTLAKLKIERLSKEITSVIYCDISHLYFGISGEKTVRNSESSYDDNTKFCEWLEFNVYLTRIPKSTLFWFFTASPERITSLDHKVIGLLQNNGNSVLLGTNVNAEIFFPSLRLIYRVLIYLKSIYSFLRLKNMAISPSILYGSGVRSRKSLKNRFDAPYWDIKSQWISNTPDKPSPNNKKIIFVEESVIKSSDSSLLNIPSAVGNLQDYFDFIDKVFCAIESRYKLQVQVCASGRYVYKTGCSEFGKRDIIYGHTLNEISGDTLVLAHNSLSLLQAIYKFSPIIFIDYEFRNLKKRLSIWSMANFLQRPIIRRRNLGSIMTKDSLYSLTEVQRERYTLFTKLYIESNKNVATMTDLLCGYLSSKTN